MMKARGRGVKLTLPLLQGTATQPSFSSCHSFLKVQFPPTPSTGWLVTLACQEHSTAPAVIQPPPPLGGLPLIELQAECLSSTLHG